VPSVDFYIVAITLTTMATAQVRSVVTSVPVSVSGAEQSVTFNWRVENVELLDRCVKGRAVLPCRCRSSRSLAGFSFEMVIKFETRSNYHQVYRTATTIIIV